MNDVELSALEIKPYISTQKNCRPSASGYVMEAIDSLLTIDLSSYEDNLKTTITTKRISGNGKIKINGSDYEALSKDSNILELNITNKKIEFARDSNCIGKVVISNIKISSNLTNIQTDLNPSYIENNTETNIHNWRSLLLKHGETKGIRLIENKLLVSEGAVIQRGSLINSIVTNPPQCFNKSSNIKFIYPCEITEVSFGDGFISNNLSTSKYKHFSQSQELQPVKNNMSEKTQTNPAQNSNVLYDSFETGLHANLLSNAKEMVSGQGKNNNGALMKREGKFSIPMSIMRPHMQYVVVVNIKKISGNGKFGIGIFTTDGQTKSTMVTISTERENELYLKLNTGDPPTPGNSYELRFFRPDDSTVGDVLLNRIMVINGIALAHFNQQTSKHVVSYTSDKFTNKKEKDPIRALAKTYSRSICHDKRHTTFDFNAEISLRSQPAINWFNKIRPLCPKIKTKTGSKILISELGSLVEAEKIWLEEFNEEISEKDEEILNKAKVIITPSLDNKNTLNNLFRNAKVYQLEKTWPMIEPTLMKYLPDTYSVMFYRDKRITKRVVEAYNIDMPLVIIGALESYEGNVIQLNEYIPYDKITSVLCNSKFLIDVPMCDNYNSGLLSLAYNFGVPILTSNGILGENGGKIISANEKIDELKVPAISEIKAGIDDILKFSKNDIRPNHNEGLKEVLQALCE